MNKTYPLYNIPPFKCVIYDVVINLLLISIIPRHPDDHQSLRSRKPQIPTSIDHYHIKQRHVYTCHCNPCKIISIKDDPSYTFMTWETAP